MVLIPNPNYRANPKRAIFVQGMIDQGMVDRLTPQIVSLQAANRDPITIYIDSPGGSTSSQELLYRLLAAKTQDSEDGCHLITVVTGRAASAAADLLCSGAYAIAYPDSRIFFHGVRTFSDDPLTVTEATRLIEQLRLTNDRYATTLADKSIWRLGWRYVWLRSKFDEYRKGHDPEASDLDCFLGLIRPRLSSSADIVVRRALRRNQRYLALFEKIARVAIRRRRFREPKTLADQEAEVLKALVDFELREHSKEINWRFADRGLGQLNADFLLANEYINIYDSPHLKRLCDRFGSLFLNAEDWEELNAIQNEAERDAAKQDKLKPTLRPLWLFFVALCYELQTGENDLTSMDALWVGLIDEVIGAPLDAAPERLIIETQALAPEGTPHQEQLAQNS